MKHRLLWVIFALMLVTASAIAVLPARWLIRAIPAHWPLAIVDASGTVWSGSAAMAVGPSHSRRRLPDPLRWHWSFDHGPRMTLSHPWLSGPLLIAFSPNGVTLSAQAMTLPAQALATLDARIAAVGPEGLLTVKWPATRIVPPPARDGATLLQAEWREAASALAPVRPLGTYTLQLTQASQGTELALATLGGPLLLEGAGSLSPRTGLEFKGTAQADPAANAATHRALQDILNALGPRKNHVTLLHYR